MTGNDALADRIRAAVSAVGKLEGGDPATADAYHYLTALAAAVEAYERGQG